MYGRARKKPHASKLGYVMWSIHCLGPMYARLDGANVPQANVPAIVH